MGRAAVAGDHQAGDVKTIALALMFAAAAATSFYLIGTVTPPIHAPTHPPAERGAIVDAADKADTADTADKNVEPEIIFGPLAKQARVIPHMEAGKPAGLEVSAVVPGSELAKAGIKDGDVVTGVNGRALASPEDALEAYEALKDAKVFDVAVMRGGKAKTIHYQVRE